MDIRVRQIPQLEVNGYPLRDSGHSGDEKRVSSGTSDDKNEKEAASRLIVDVPMRSFQGGEYDESSLGGGTDCGERRLLSLVDITIQASPAGAQADMVHLFIQSLDQ